MSQREAAATADAPDVQEVWTHFGWACKQLGIEIITAHSPEAKGRVERNHGIYRDRLVKELRLAGINTIAAVNQVLAGGFCEQLNWKFAVALNYGDVDRSQRLFEVYRHDRVKGRKALLL